MPIHMKKLFFVLLFPMSFFAQEKLTLDNILTIPVADRPNWSSEEIQKEIAFYFLE